MEFISSARFMIVYVLSATVKLWYPAFFNIIVLEESWISLILIKSISSSNENAHKAIFSSAVFAKVVVDGKMLPSFNI